MKKWIAILISMVVYFGVYVLFDYLFSKNIDWIMATISSIIFAIIESVLFQFTEKRK